MENILLAAVIGVAVWLFMRNARTRRERGRGLVQPPPVSDNEPQPKSMPRIGVAGTITREQMGWLKENQFEPHRQWSKDEAQLILDSVTYLRAAIRMETGETDAPFEIQNNVLGFILIDDELRENVLDWGLNRTHEEENAGEDVDLPPDETFERVANHIRELWEDG